MAAPRIVSLIASSTEIVSALGLEANLIGRSHECDYPESVKRLPPLTEPKFDTNGTSREIDERVKQTLQDALSVYSVNEDLLQKLAPDIIITQSQCEVCAVSLNDVERAVRDRLSPNAHIVSLEPNALDDVWADIRRVAEAAGVPERGEKLVRRSKDRMAAIADRADRLSHRPAICCIEWIDPLMAAGNWMPELVGIAGGENLFGAAGEHSPWMSWEDLKEKDPEVIVVTPCGYDLKKTREEMAALTGQPGWGALHAVKSGRVFLTDGNQYFNRPGPRLVESLEILAELLHPTEFDFGHRGTGWEPL